jgi:ABC-2 type transport system ATP-binding protein
MIQIRNLTKRFGAVEAIVDLTLTVPEASVFALIGPNGAGKTTTIKTLMNILRPTSGRAQILGVDSRKLGPAQFARIGYVSENQSLPDWMPVGYFLSYCRAFYPAWDNELLHALVRLYGLPLDRKLGSLSRGMRVKAAFASSLAYRPRLIILDEPFGGLDPLIRDQVIESTLDRASESTVLISSHDLSEIETFASHIAWLECGRLQFVEETQSLLDRFREVEITLDRAAQIPAEWPSRWLNPEQSSAIIRFTDSGFSRDRTEAEVRRLFAGVREISARPLPMRSIAVALGRASQNRSRTCA